RERAPWSPAVGWRSRRPPVGPSGGSIPRRRAGGRRASPGTGGEAGGRGRGRREARPSAGASAPCSSRDARRWRHQEPSGGSGTPAPRRRSASARGRGAGAGGSAPRRGGSARPPRGRRGVLLIQPRLAQVRDRAGGEVYEPLGGLLEADVVAAHVEPDERDP